MRAAVALRRLAAGLEQVCLAPGRPQAPSRLCMARPHAIALRTLAGMALAAFALAIAAGPASADDIDDSVASLKKDAPYAPARLPLFAAGWVPAPEDRESGPEARCSFRTDICLAYPEAEACSGTGMGYCAFRFEKDGAALWITTVGEPVTDLTVYDWRLERP